MCDRNPSYHVFAAAVSLGKVRAGALEQLANRDYDKNEIFRSFG